MALNCSIEITITTREDDIIAVNYLDINDNDSFALTENITYRHSRDYLRSCFNVLKKKGIHLTTGANLTVKGDIPISAGLSSSSALSVASILAFSTLAEKKLSLKQLANFAFEGEVVEFGESGGMMDHYSSVFGGIIHVDFGEKTQLKTIPTFLDGFVIGDSLEKKKDTVGDLKIIRETVEKGYQYLSEIIPHFNHRETPLTIIEENIEDIPKENQLITLTTIKNRDLTKKALKFLSNDRVNQKRFGELLDEHHTLLRDGFQRSTEKIERLISAAKNAGALGCKINGSGLGGTILAYAPSNEQKVAKAIEEVGGKPYFIKTSPGARVL